MKTGRIAVLAFFSLLAIATSSTAATLTGVVRDASTGAALASMNVDAYSTSGVRVSGATTTASGAYTLTLPAGSYRLLAYDAAGNYATAFHASAESFDTSTVLTVTSSQAATVNFALERAGWLTGRVLGDGVPVAGATVAAYNASGTTRGWTRTDATGTYRLALPAGSYRLAAWDESLTWLPRFAGGAATFADAATLPVQAQAETRADFALPKAAFITGTVVDAATRTPLASAVVDVWKADGTYVGWGQTSSTGSYRLAVEEGSYRLVFSDPAGILAPAYAGDASSFAASAPVTLAPGQSRTVDAALVRGGRISGRITDAKSGAPIAGASVAAWNPDGTPRTIVRTNASGEYVLIVPPGVYRIGAWDETLRYAARFRYDTPFFSQAATLTVIAGDATGSIDLALPAATPSRRRAASH